MWEKREAVGRARQATCTAVSIGISSSRRLCFGKGKTLGRRRESQCCGPHEPGPAYHWHTLGGSRWGHITGPEKRKSDTSSVPRYESPTCPASSARSLSDAGRRLVKLAFARTRRRSPASCRPVRSSWPPWPAASRTLRREHVRTSAVNASRQSRGTDAGGRPNSRLPCLA